MKIKFEHLGIIESGEVEVKPLTVLCGPNNSGKTYLMYALYGLLDKDFNIRFSFVKNLIYQAKNKGICHFSIKELLHNNINSIIASIEDNFIKCLPTLFSTTEDTFSNTKVQLSNLNLDKTIENIKNTEWDYFLNLANKKMVYELIKDKNSDKATLIILDGNTPTRILEKTLSNTLSLLLLPELVRYVFLLPAERTGINLFFRELNFQRTTILHNTARGEINAMAISRYPEPLADYINFLNQINELKNNKSYYHSFALELQKEVLKGSFRISKDMNIVFKPYPYKDTSLNLHLSSSTAKTFFGLWTYLKYVAQPNQCLMIDEPELNLHPDNQRKLARILVRLANNGLTVIISTHSD